MGQVLSLPFKLLHTTKTFVFGFFFYLSGPGRKQPFSCTESSSFRPIHPLATDTPKQKLFKQHARVHLFSLASNFYLYNKPHYRKGTYRDDLIDNLRNVAIPGTGIPLSWMVRSRLVAIPFLLTMYPVVSLLASFQQWIQSRGKTSISEEYQTRLLAPNDWFNYWRHNCNLVGLHALLNDFPVDYEMENKWTFLKHGEQLNVPVSPFLKIPALVVKHRNEEGGMGIYFYKNAVCGGDWILQERIDNSDWVASLLPKTAPLSTFRVITCSKAYDMNEVLHPSNVTALSCVFRAGRAGAATDHDSILFDINIQTGRVGNGTTNAHWYKLGLWNAISCPWRSHHDYTNHPDGCNLVVAGTVVPDIAQVLRVATEAHYKLCPRVPLAGWDVVLAANTQQPLCLLEVNLSCNFFRGSFDVPFYLDFYERALQKLQQQRLVADTDGKQFSR